MVIAGGIKAVMLRQPLCSLELFTFTSELIIKTCFRSSLKYHNPCLGSSYTPSLGECASFLIRPFDILGQTVSHVIQRVSSGWIWKRHLEDYPLPSCKTTEELCFGATVQGHYKHIQCVLLKERCNLNRNCTTERHGLYIERASPENCDKPAHFKVRWEIAVPKGKQSQQEPSWGLLTMKSHF